MQQILDSRVAGVGLRGDAGDLGCQSVRGLLADARQAVMMKFDERGVECQHNLLLVRFFRFLFQRKIESQNSLYLNRRAI
jgi:hypothetical protein